MEKDLDTVPVAGADLHFIHEIGSGSSPTPLIISHGWPGSIVEFLEVIEPLAHPERFGGDPQDAFDVIAERFLAFKDLAGHARIVIKLSYAAL